MSVRPAVRPFPPVDTVAAPCGSPAVLHLHRYYGFVRLLFGLPPVRVVPSAHAHSVGTRNDGNFEVQFSRPAFSLCTLRTRRSPDGMATLATGLPATALTGLASHQLDLNREFHCFFSDSLSP